MKSEFFQLITELGVALLSPFIYHYYLWRYKGVSKSVIFQNIKIYAVLYLLIAIVVSILIIKT